MAPDVALRPVRLPAEREFLISVYAFIRMPELGGLPWPQADLQGFIAMQFDAQTRHYAMLWEQLGLRAGQSDGVYVEMERPCATSRR